LGTSHQPKRKPKKSKEKSVFTRKTRTLIATTAAALAVAVVPASSSALTSKPTGDKRLDDYCAQAGALIDRALREGDLALVNGDDEGASAWYVLAADMIKRSQARGCDFGFRKVRRLLRSLDLGAVQTGPAPTVGTAPEPTGPRVDDGSVKIGGLTTG
jgi:hypothetical protein